MSNATRFLLAIVIVIAIALPVLAVPNTGAAVSNTSNNVTIPLTGITGSSVYVLYGPNEGMPVWASDNYTPSGGSADVVIWGAPLIGGSSYYATGCDDTGCDPTWVPFTISTITPLPTTTLGSVYQTMANSHFSPVVIPIALQSVYVDSIPRTLFYGIILGLMFIGIWMRTHSIRMVSSLGIMLGGFLFSDASGLFLGIPLQEQLLGLVLLAAGLAGWVVSLFVKK